MLKILKLCNQNIIKYYSVNLDVLLSVIISFARIKFLISSFIFSLKCATQNFSEIATSLFYLKVFRFSVSIHSLLKYQETQVNCWMDVETAVYFLYFKCDMMTTSGI